MSKYDIFELNRVGRNILTEVVRRLKSSMNDYFKNDRVKCVFNYRGTIVSAQVKLDDLPGIGSWDFGLEVAFLSIRKHDTRKVVVRFFPRGYPKQEAADAFAAKYAEAMSDALKDFAPEYFPADLRLGHLVCPPAWVIDEPPMTMLDPEAIASLCEKIFDRIGKKIPYTAAAKCSYHGSGCTTAD